jgi:hypothetical protein
MPDWPAKDWLAWSLGQQKTKKGPIAQAGSGGGGQARAPPWQVLSSKDAKKNVEKEKVRREKIKQGILDPSAEIKLDEPVAISKAFLSTADQSFLGWKRFNPTTVPAGMRFVASVLDNNLPPCLGVPEIAFLGRSNVGKSDEQNSTLFFTLNIL